MDAVYRSKHNLQVVKASLLVYFVDLPRQFQYQICHLGLQYQDFQKLLYEERYLGYPMLLKHQEIQ
jgi:hypothetical protein